MLLMLCVFIAGMLFEHFVFHKVEEKIMDLKHKVDNLLR
jgi:hypothetical protein